MWHCCSSEIDIAVVFAASATAENVCSTNQIRQTGWLQSMKPRDFYPKNTSFEYQLPANICRQHRQLISISLLLFHSIAFPMLSAQRMKQKMIIFGHFATFAQRFHSTILFDRANKTMYLQIRALNEQKQSNNHRCDAFQMRFGFFSFKWQNNELLNIRPGVLSANQKC